MLASNETGVLQPVAEAAAGGEPEVHFPCDDVLVAIGQENAFPWIERDLGIEFDEWGMPVVDKVSFASTRAEAPPAGSPTMSRSPMLWRTRPGAGLDAARWTTQPRTRSSGSRASRDRRGRPPRWSTFHSVR